MPIITQADIEDRIGQHALRRCLDHDNDGMADSGAVAAALADGIAFAKSYLLMAYDDDLLEANAPAEAKRLCVRSVLAHLYIMKPEVFRIDGHEVLKEVRMELKDIAANKRRMSDSAPDPAAQTAAEAVPTDEDVDIEKLDHYFVDGTGSF